MNSKEGKLNAVFVSDQVFDRREDAYAYTKFGKIVNRYLITSNIVSDNFWTFLYEKLSIKKEDAIVFCDIHTDVKNRIEKFYKYIISVDKPFKILIQFYDEEKVIDSKIYSTEEQQKNKISEIFIYFDNDALEYVNNLTTEIKDIYYLPPMDKTFFVISSSSMGYDLQPANIKDIDVNVELNYGEAFVEKYENIVDKLKNNKHGLFLFHGESGCGKCVDGSTMVTIKNKITGKIEDISISDFEKLI